MPGATTISTFSRHHGTQAYDSRTLPYQAYEGTSSSTVSDSSEGVENIVVGGPRSIRAETCENLPEGRRSRAKRAMTSHTPRRTYSESKEPRVVVREVRRKSDSEHRKHHRRSEKDDAREDDGVYVYKAHKRSEAETHRSRPSTRRRSTTNVGEASRTRPERQRTEDRDLRRRHSERKPSHREEKVHTPLRREKRSIVDHVPKSTRDRAPITR